ncbi:hypothetical protein Golob_027175, partial [Gossypium lobatum]|nr:hypothetical protein [Gossypium lobatum]
WTTGSLIFRTRKSFPGITWVISQAVVQWTVFSMNCSMILMLVPIHTLVTRLDRITLIHTLVSMSIPKLCLPQLKIRLQSMTLLVLGRNKSKKRPLGNREAVRKYREKVKAQATSLEDEVMRLRAVNQQLLKRLQGQAALEAEVARLKCLLVDIRGRIEGEIGSFPYQKSATAVNGMNMPGAYVMNPCNVQCNDQMYC